MKNKLDIVEELRKSIGIDKHNLDEEFTRAPELFRQIAEMFAEAQIDQASIKVDIENAEADLYIQFRQQAEDEREKQIQAEEKPEKVTDTAINRKVNTSPRLRKLQRSLLEAAKRVSELGALKESYQQRGYALNNLTSLYTANYWQRESGGKLRSEMKENIADRNRSESGKLRRAKRGEE